MKKTLALILAFAMVFSTISFVFADEEVVAISDEAAALGTLGVLVGDGGGVTVEYTAKELNRLTAAIMVLKLKGLYEEALEFDGVENFPDAENMAWAEGKNILAYLKANPEVGFAGDGSAFNPDAIFTEQMLYKVLLESLGYKQTTGEVVGDFAWDGTIAFAEEIGLKPENAEKLTVDGLAKAVVGALKAENKDGKVWIDVLVEAGKVDEENAVAAGFVKEAPVLVEVAVKEVKALGNTVVQVEYKEAVGAEAENLVNYAIEGLEVKDAAIAGEKLVRLETDAMKLGKLYVLTIGEEEIKFAGVGKVSGGPSLDEAVSEDVEEVVLTFDRNLDYEAATDVDNYYIANVEIVEAEVDGDEVTLTTEGLKDKSKYTVKVSDMKSIDGIAKKSSSTTFTVRVDKLAPKIDSSESAVETNQRIVLYFNEEITQESAEDIDNYTIKDTKSGEELDVISVEWDDDDKNNVEIVTEEQTKNAKYKLTVENISDTRKVPNVMTRPAIYEFDGMKEDKTAPKVDTHAVRSEVEIYVRFKDDSRVDEESMLDANNYTFSKGNEDLAVDEIIKIKGKEVLVVVEEMEYDATGYKLKISDIMDEFGNAMKTETISLSRIGAVASAQPGTPVVTDKNTIKVTFDNELIKETAEDISNYKIDGDIGVPKKAKYKDKVVTLTVNELIDGKEYELTIDGVKDLVDNELYFEKTFDAIALKEGSRVKWDNDAPELEGFEILNKFLVALTFSEEIDKNKAIGVRVELVSDEDTPETVTLTGGALVEDDTVVEFYSASGLTDGVAYEVYKIVYDPVYEIADLAGNPFKWDEDYDFYEKYEDKNQEFAEFEGAEQVNGRTFKITMSRDVFNTAGTKFDAKVGTSTKTNFFEVERIKDNTVFIVASEDLDSGIEYEVNLNDFVKDVHGVVVENDYYEDDTDVVGKTVLTGDYKDTDKPYIVDVEVLDRVTLEIEFSEDIKTLTLGDFSIKNIDITGSKADIGIDSSSALKTNNRSVLKVNLTKPLEARFEYELKMKKDAVVDYVGKKADADVFYFEGTNLAR